MAPPYGGIVGSKLSQFNRTATDQQKKPPGGSGAYRNERI
jgi:hypothetical protein